MSRRVSYAQLEGGQRSGSHSGESYASGEYEEDEEWDGASSDDDGGSTRGKSRRRYLKRANHGQEREWGGGKPKPSRVSQESALNLASICS